MMPCLARMPAQTGRAKGGTHLGIRTFSWHLSAGKGDGMKRFSLARWFILISALTLLGAACAQQAGDGDGDAGGAQATCDADEFGCVEVAQGDPITVGTLLVITGPDASLGQDSQNGVALSLDFFGTDEWPGEEGGSILGHPVEFIHQDDGCSAEGGQAGGTAPAAGGEGVGG